MRTIGEALGLVVGGLSDQNYAQSLGFYRFWLDTGRTYIQIPSDQIFDAIWNNRVAASINHDCGLLIHPAAHSIPRFASDAASDPILAPYGPELQSRLCAKSLQEFFSNNLMVAKYKEPVHELYADANLIAHWANLGYVEEAAIRDHILQSLIAHPKLYDYQVDVLIILFKLAGATFEAYTDPSVFDRCFKLLKGHKYDPPWPSSYSNYDNYLNPRTALIRVSAHCVTGYNHWAEEIFQEVVALRGRRWGGLPPPPVFTTGKPKPTNANQRDPAATPVATSLGLPNTDPEPQIPQPPPSEPATASEAGKIPESPATPVIQSPSISISTLSDFTIADASDDESPTGPTFADTSDDEPLVDPTAVVRHETFYLDDGNVEVLCGNTLFRVTISTLSFHSPALRRMFAQTSLATAESPNGCPRILSSDTAKDFATLLKMIYLPGFVTLSACCWIAPLTVCLPAGSLNEIKCQISPHSRPSSGSLQSTRCPLFDLRYSRWSVTRTQRHLRDSLLPSRLERRSSADGLPTRMRSSTSLSNRSSHSHCRWHTTWRPEGVRTR